MNFSVKLAIEGKPLYNWIQKRSKGESAMDFAGLKNFMDRLTSWRIPGSDAVVYLNNREVFRYQSGFADLESGKRMDGTQLFNIYSCSKVTTVTAAMQLYEQGRFLLTDPLCEYLPEYRVMSVRGKDGALSRAENQITLRHLFTMTAGLSYDCDTPAIRKARELTGGAMNTVAVARCLAEDPLSFEPGTRWQYSLCHDVLAAVVEVISGMPFRDYVRKNIFQPLGMEESWYHRTPEIEARMASQYRFVPEEENIPQDAVSLQSAFRAASPGRVEKVGKGAEHVFGPEYDSGGAGIVTSVSDYGRLVSALANRGLGPNGERILSPASVDLLRVNQLGPELMPDFNWKQLAGYGYGLGVRTMVDRAKGGSLGPAGEFGWGGAAGATVLADPENSLAVFYTHHMLNPQEEYYQPRLRNVVYACLGA